MVTDPHPHDVVFMSDEDRESVIPSLSGDLLNTALAIAQTRGLACAAGDIAYELGRRRRSDPHAYLREYTELAADVARRGVEGDVVETGVYNGASLRAISEGLPGRHVWAYDSFQGFPKGSLLDCDVARGLEGAVVGSPDEVRRSLDGLYSELTIREGWFEDTFREALPERIAFLSVDCDLYESVWLALITLTPRVVPGGVVTLDDWGAFVGCRRAFYHYVRATRETPWLRNFGLCQAYWVVGE